MSSVQELRASVSAPSSASAKAAKPSGGDSDAAAKAAPAGRSASVGLLVLVAAIGVSAGIGLDRFVLPHGAASPEPAAVAAPQAASPGDTVATGSFIQPDANNPLNHGAGGVSVSGREVVLGADFTVTPGPDYRVLLVPKAAIRASEDVAKTMYVDLGPLAAFKGSQHFAVPAGVDLSRYPSVVIWCAPYGTLISTADLSFGK